MKAINPFTGAVCGTYPHHNESDVQRIIEKVDLASKSWPLVPMAERKIALLKLAEILLRKKDWLADLISDEMGKVKKEALGELEKCAWVCRYYADNAERYLAPESIETEATEAYISYQPLGTILAIMPWNFPFWQVFRFLAPALMAGNTGILKHASNVPGCAMVIEQLVSEAGFPPNVFRTILVSGSEVKAIIENPVIKAVTLTGSTPAGKAVAKAAGAVLKKTVLELGGSDPYLILEDADIPAAAQACASGRLLNSGQSCIGAKRFIVMEAVYEQFKREFLNLMQAANYGDPKDPETKLGPLARVDLRDELHQQVEASVAKGARLLCGGFIPDEAAPFYPATVLENVEKGMPAYDEELFGPVASLIKVATVEEGLKIANDTVFGLGAAVFTSQVDKAREIAEKGLDSGCVFVNDFVKSDPRLPFGGVKQSGYGRELSLVGIREFVNVKTIVVK